MSLVGDVIISARELIPDMPQVLPAPQVISVTPANTTNGNAGTGPFVIVATFTTPWGETAPSLESSGTITVPNNTLQIILALNGYQRPFPIVTGTNIYIGNGSGNEMMKYSFPGVLPGATITLDPTGNPTYQAPPNRSTAFLADSDGTRMFSAGTLYRWLNEGMRRLSLKVGGIQDYSGVGSISGQSLYTLAGEWRKIDSIWYDGFPLGLGNQGGFFRRNNISSTILASAAISIRTNQVVLEVFYQPSRTAGVSTLSLSMGIADTTAFVVNLANFQSFGPPMFALIGTEIVALSAFSGNSLINLLRGVGGTIPQAWPAGTAVKELNIPLIGKRLHTQQYTSGNAINTLPVPIGWESILPTYILSKARTAEQDTQAAAALLKEFDDAGLEMLRANRQIAGPTQVGGGMYGAETVPGFGTQYGGVVLP